MKLRAGILSLERAVMGGRLCAASALGQHGLASPLPRHRAAAQLHR
jgi:hypothetical protein